MQLMSLEDRVAGLERSNRRLRLGVFVFCALTALLCVFGFRSAQFTDLIRARELDIVGANGHTVVVIKAEKGGGVMTTSADEGKGAVVIRANTLGNIIQMQDSAGAVNATLGVAPESKGFLLLGGSNKTGDSTLLGLGHDGLRLYRGEGKAVVLGADDNGGFVITAKEGAVTGGLPGKQ